MWTGLMQRRCVNVELGYSYSYANFTTMCTKSDDCGNIYTLAPLNPGTKYICAKTDLNPFFGVASFDDFYHSMTVVFLIITMEGWTDYFAFVSKTFTDDIGINLVIIFLFFHLFLFMGGYYLMNLFLAVVWSKFSEIERLNKKTNQATKGSLADKILAYKEGEKIPEADESKLSEEQKIDKLREKFVFIDKDPSKIPISYKTINDIFLMESLTPRESYHLNNRISLEAIRAEELFEKATKEVRNNSQNSVKYSLANSVTVLMKSNSVLSGKTLSLDSDPNKEGNRDRVKKSTTVISSQFFHKQVPKIMIIRECVDEAIRKTIEIWDDDMRREIEKATEDDVVLTKTKEVLITETEKKTEVTPRKALNNSLRSDLTDPLDGNDDKYKNELKRILALVNRNDKQREDKKKKEDNKDNEVDNLNKLFQDSDQVTVSENSINNSSNNISANDIESNNIPTPLPANPSPNIIAFSPFKVMSNNLRIDIPYHKPINVIKNFKKNEYYPNQDPKNEEENKKIERRGREASLKESIEDRFIREQAEKENANNGNKRRSAFGAEIDNLKYGLEKNKDENKKARLYDDLDISDNKIENLDLSISHSASNITNSIKMDTQPNFDFEENANKKYNKSAINKYTESAHAYKTKIRKSNTLFPGKLSHAQKEQKPSSTVRSETHKRTKTKLMTRGATVIDPSHFKGAGNDINKIKELLVENNQKSKSVDNRFKITLTVNRNHSIHFEEIIDKLTDEIDILQKQKEEYESQIEKEKELLVKASKKDIDIILKQKFTEDFFLKQRKCHNKLTELKSKRKELRTKSKLNLLYFLTNIYISYLILPL